MSRIRPRPLAGALTAGLVLGGVAGCSERADTGPAASVQTPPPPLPVWATPLMGKMLKAVRPRQGACVGVFDLVTVRHMGSQPGAEGQGWGWDTQAKAPLSKVVFTDESGRIVGAGEGGSARPDVPKARADVTSGSTGWKGVMHVNEGKVSVSGLLGEDGACPVASTTL